MPYQTTHPLTTKQTILNSNIYFTLKVKCVTNVGFTQQLKFKLWRISEANNRSIVSKVRFI